MIYNFLGLDCNNQNSSDLIDSMVRFYVFVKFFVDNMKKKLTFLAFSLLLAVGWTNVAQAQLKVEPKLKSLTQKVMKPATDVSNPVVNQELDAQIPFMNLNSRPDVRFHSETLDVSKRAPMRRAPRRAVNNVTAKATLTFDQADAISYDWYDANGGHHNNKITEPASDSYQIAYLLGTSYMNPAIPGLKYSAVFDQDNPYTNIEFGWDIPNNSRWPQFGESSAATTYSDLVIDLTSDFIFKSITVYNANGAVLTSWDGNTAVSNRQYGSYTYDGDTYYYYTFPGWSYSSYIDIVGFDNDDNYYAWYSWQSAGTLTIPSTLLNGTPNISVVIEVFSQTAGATLTVGGEGKPISTTLDTYTWTFNGSPGADAGKGLTIAAPDSLCINSITVTNQSGTTLQSWNSVTAYQNGEFNSNDGYYTIPNWVCTKYFLAYSTSEYVPGLYGYLYDDHIHIPASLLAGSTSLTVTVNAFGLGGGERIVVNGEEKTVTTSATDYTWTITDLSAGTGAVTPPTENGYTVFLVKVNDNVPAAMHPSYTYSWNNGTTSLIDFFETYIDEVQLLTDGTRLNEDTDDAGTMFAYSGELGRFYFLGKGKDYWFGSSESDRNPQLAPTYDMYEEFSPTSTDNGADITDFYSKLLYGNSYNVIHDCRGMNYFQHYFTMSGLAGDEHRSMTNLIFWIPDNRGLYGDRNYDEEYLPHVGLYTITLDAEAERAADYSTSNRMYDVTLDWVSSLNSILDFDVDQDYELWVYIYDDQGNPVADYKVLDRLQMQDLLVHNNTTFTYQVPQTAESQTIVYRVKGWPVAASNTPGKHPDDPEKGNFFVLSNLDPVLIPGYENFLSLGVEHYESDFALDVEHNYYRNFLTIDNENPDNPLTAKRIENGEDQYELYRYDIAKPNQLTKAADLLFTVDNVNNKVEYIIDYVHQDYIDEANLYNEYNDDFIKGYTDPDALGCPTYGVIANLSEGGGEIAPTTYDNITIQPSGNTVNFQSIIVKSTENSEIIKWTTSNGRTLPTGLTCSGTWNYSSSYGGYTSGTLTVDGSLLAGYTNVQVVINAYGDTGGTRTITVNGQSQTIQNGSSSTADYTWNITPSGGGAGDFELLNNFLDNSTYTQVGQVVFPLPWKSIQVKLQDESAGTSNGFFLIQNGGKLRFVMPAGYNNANLRFVIHNAPVTSEYYDGTFTLTSSTGDTQTITILEGSSVYGDRDYEAIFSGISSGDVITITGTHTENGTLYNYSPDFKYIHVYVQGGTGGISENTPLNLDAIKFVDQFKESTSSTDPADHPLRYGYVLKAVGSNQESGRPEIPVQHTGSSLDGFYTLSEIQNDKVEPLLEVNVMNAEVNMTLSREPEIYYYTLDRKPSNENNAQWEAISKLQRRGDDSYQEMFDNLEQYDGQICNPPTITSAPWIVDRYDNYDIKQGGYDSYMSYVPVIWTHGDQKNRRLKWDIENRHNSYGAPIWKTGVAQVVLTKGLAQRQEDPSTKWTFAGEECSLYMLDNIEAEATMPTITNVNYVPYMFRIFVKSNSHKLRGFQQVPAGEDPNKPGEHYEGAYIENDSLLCVWSGYVNDPKNADYGVTISDDIVNGAKVYTFHKDKVDRSVAGGEWDKDIENAIFAAPEGLIQGEGENRYISGNDLTIVVRFYYLVEGFDDSAPENLVPNRDGGSDPAGYGAEGQGFTPGPATGVKEMVINGIIESVTYVNAQGMQSDQPFDGLNIVITRYSNGTTRTTKLMR